MMFVTSDVVSKQCLSVACQEATESCNAQHYMWGQGMRHGTLFGT